MVNKHTDYVIIRPPEEKCKAIRQFRSAAERASVKTFVTAVLRYCALPGFEMMK